MQKYFLAIVAVFALFTLVSCQKSEEPMNSDSSSLYFRHDNSISNNKYSTPDSSTQEDNYVKETENNSISSQNDKNINSDQDEEMIIMGNPTTDDVLSATPEADIFLYNGIVCLKVTSDHWANNENYEPIELVGTIIETKENDNLGELEARFLPVGTEIYTTDNPEILLAKTNDGSYIKYHMQIEG